MGFGLLVLLVAFDQTVREDGAILRAACGSSEEPVATLRQGEPLVIRFAFAGEAGPCYKVAVTRDGRTLEGYLPSASIAGLDSFDKARHSAAGFDRPQSPRRETAAPVGAPSTRDLRDAVTRASELLAANQPGEALALLETALRANRRDAGVLALAGMAAYQSDQPSRAVDYWKESLELAPNASVERMLQKAQREAAADLSVEKLYGMRFLFRYDGRQVTAEQARSIVPMLDAEFTRISEQLGCRAEERIVVIMQSREAYLRTTGAAEWSGGRYDGRIRVALHDGGAAGAQTRRALSHEIVHACLARTGAWPAWLHEGLAQKLSGESLAPQQRETLRAMARTGELPSLRRLGHTWSRLSARHAAAAYALALAAADLFYESQGSWGVRNLLQNPAALDRVADDLEQRLKKL